MNYILWSDEYHIDKIERIMKNEIRMHFFAKEERIPTMEEYQVLFANWLRRLKCEVTNYDLGIYE